MYREYTPRQPCGRARFYGRIDRRLVGGVNAYTRKTLRTLNGTLKKDSERLEIHREGEDPRSESQLQSNYERSIQRGSDHGYRKAAATDVRRLCTAAASRQQTTDSEVDHRAQDRGDGIGDVEKPVGVRPAKRPQDKINVRRVGKATCIPKTRYLCMEEGTQSQWLYDLLSRHVEEMLVVQPKKIVGNKDDIRDAYRPAEDIRIGAAKPTFKQLGQYKRLKSMTHTYSMVQRDTVRIQSRIKATYRS
jgi:hypothetical protein